MRLTIIRHSIRNRGGDRLILDYLSYLVQKDHEVVYWTNEINTHFPIDAKIQIKQIPWRGVLGTIVFTLFKKFKTDIVLVDLVVMSVLAGILNGKLVVYLAQDDDKTYYSSPYLRKLIDGFYRLSLSIMKTRVICVSEYLAGQLQKYSPHQMSVVSNGIDPKKFYREGNPRFLSEKRNLAVIVLYARTDYRKGLDIGMKAIGELKRIRNSKDWELWTIGSDAANIYITEVNIKNWGGLKDNDLRAVLSTADIFLSPSRHEGFGLMQLEAMACVCAMVTTEAFTLVKNEFNALVSPSEDWKSLAKNLNRILSDAILKQKLISNAYSLLEEYNFDKSCEKFEKELLSFDQIKKDN